MKKSTAVIASLFAVATALPIASHAWQEARPERCEQKPTGYSCTIEQVKFHPPRGKFGYYDWRTKIYEPSTGRIIIDFDRTKRSTKVNCEEWTDKMIGRGRWEDIRPGSNGDYWAEIACARD